MQKIYKQIIHKFLLFGMLVVLLLMSGQSFSQRRDCENSGLEYGDFTNWSGWIGSYAGFTDPLDINSGLTLNPTALPTAPRITLVNPGFDQYIPTLATVYEGNNAIMLGSNSGGTNAERVVYTIPVTNANKIFKYNYAVVLEVPGHTAAQMPFFSARVLIGKTVICETGRKTSGTGDPFFQTFNGYEYRDWDCVVCDLSDYVGQTATIEFTVASCSLGAHFGYAYIDGLCNSELEATFSLDKTTYCLGETISMDATATVGETYYYLTLEESDANGGRPNPASEMILYFPNQTVGVEDITSIFESNGFVFKCNTYYRLKLAVGNTCNPWEEMVKVIYISCPKLELGRDICIECKKGVTHMVRLGDPNASTASHLFYQWSPTTGLQNPNSPTTTLYVNAADLPITYTLTVTDLRSGCTNSDQVTVRCKVTQPRLIKIPNCCGIIIRMLDANNYTNVVWSTGATNVSEIQVSEIGTYSVTVSNSCSSATASVNVTQQDIGNIERYYRNLDLPANQSYYSSGTNVNSYNAFYIMWVEDPQPTYGMYNATEYRLEIWNRWGENIRTIEGQIPNCNGFPNPGIFWDGTVNGVQVQQDVYNAQLYFKNCPTENWKQVKVHYCNEWSYACNNWDCVGGLGFSCGFFQMEVCTSWSSYCSQQYHEYIFPITIVW